MKNAINIPFLAVLSSQVCFVAGTVNECKNEILYSVFGTFGLSLVLTVILIAVYMNCQSKVQQKRGQVQKRNDIEGRRNRVYEDESSTGLKKEKRDSNCHKRQDSGFIASSNESIIPFPDTIPKRSPSMPNLPTRRSSYDEQTSNDHSKEAVETKSVATCTYDDLNHEEIGTVTIEKKSFNSAGLDFGTAGIYIKGIDMKDISFINGTIQPGDEVISINNYLMEGLNHMEAFSHFARSGSEVNLSIVKRKYLQKALNVGSEIKLATKDAPVNISCAKTTNGVALNQHETEVMTAPAPDTQLNTVQCDLVDNTCNDHTVEIPSEAFDYNQNIKEKENFNTNHLANNPRDKSRSTEDFNLQEYKRENCCQAEKVVKYSNLLNKSLDHNVSSSFCGAEDIYMKRVRSEENLRQQKNNSFSRNINGFPMVSSSDLMSYEEYLQQISATRSQDQLDSKSRSFEATSPTTNVPRPFNTAYSMENLIIQRGYNKDYIGPLNGPYQGLPRSQLPIPRLHTTVNAYITQPQLTNTPSLLNTTSVEPSLEYSIPSSPIKINGSVSSCSANYPVSSYDMYMKNTLINNGNNGEENNKEIQIELDADVMRYMSKKYSEPRIQRKDPPPYSSAHTTINQNTQASSKPDSECTVIRRHTQRKSRPHSYTESSNMNKTKPIDSTKSADDTHHENNFNEQERRNYPKRAHSMPAVKHLEGRPKVAKTFLEKESKQRNHKKSRHRHRNHKDEADRRKSIDSGTLHKLAKEIQNNPSLEGEYPFISKLLGESQFAASERRAQTLYRYKSSEAICSHF